MSEKSERYDQGMATRRSVLGASYVDAATAKASTYDEPFQTLITEAAWGHVWSRDTITKRERSMMTLALLAGLGNFEELALHTRATANTGASRDDIMEAMLHVAIYAGVPRANHAIKVVKQVLDEMDGGQKP
ncbi:MAG: 4-carboxymuconolactone decarboxylase [Rhizobiaceae bacterium]|nr:4-carboxymuconolactone decarboxylase [Rhizobiaceae bacterium]